MKPMSASPTATLTKKTRFVVADNSGAKEVELITTYGWKGRKRMIPKAGIASLISVAVKKGKPEMRKKVEKAVVVRTKKEYRRADGLRVKFEDNAVVLVDDAGIPKATEIKGPVAKEAVERFPKIAAIAPIIV